MGIVDGIPDLTLPGFAQIEVEMSMMLAGHDAPDAHGTEICSIFFDRRMGLAKEASGVVLPIFFGAPNGHAATPRASQMDIARALTMAAERAVDIVNISAGQLSATPEAGRHLEDALQLCHRRRMLVVAAAGNDGCACLHVPAAVSTVLAVGAMDNNRRPLATSNFGANYARNGILAPGVDIPVLTIGGERITKTGTSYATAIVSGIAARLLATAKRYGYGLDAQDIRTLLIETTDPCDEAFDGDCARVLAGKLNVSGAIEELHRRGRLTRDVSSPGVVIPSTTTRRGPMIDHGMDQSTSETCAAIPAPPPLASTTTAVGQLACSCGGSKNSGCSCGGKEMCTCNGKHARDAHEAIATRPAQAASLIVKSDVEQPAVIQQGCSCGGSKEPQKVYSIGALWFDFGNEARYDAIVQQMGDPVQANNPPALLNFLSANLPFASGITFILMQDQIPIYAIAPSGPFAADIYREMIDAMQSSMSPTGDLQRVAVPGFVHGSTRLMNGMVLPVLYPDIRGMVKWEAPQLVEAAKAAIGDDESDEASIFNFLVRVYDELRNLGMSPEERAINFAATNAYQAATAFADSARRKLELYRLAVKKSPICRPDSDCWDVQMVMFDPENDRRAGRFYRFTVDVSEVLPVTVGPMRSWSAPLSST
ncbi:PatA/PatG family cyanobactin maturation protease [Sinorhizobium medicae]|nr:PatA/PatG family cyanobactin maturation protease [Sinorhizobium medicae]MDX0634255.1 PatA/PatG family cyanobactin maturation protease [Sinorhizobium medicae]